MKYNLTHKNQKSNEIEFNINQEYKKIRKNYKNKEWEKLTQNSYGVK